MNSLVFDRRSCRTLWFVSFSSLFHVVAAWCCIDFMPFKSVFRWVSSVAEFCLACLVFY